MSAPLATVIKRTVPLSEVPPEQTSLPPEVQQAHINQVLETAPATWPPVFFLAIVALHGEYTELETEKVQENQLIGKPEHSPSPLLITAVQQKTEALSKLQQEQIERAYGLFMTMAMESDLSKEIREAPEFSKMAKALCSQLVKNGLTRQPASPRNPKLQANLHG
jgi:hypothetical protein